MVWKEWALFFFLGFHQTFVLLNSDALLCGGAPVDAGRPELAGYGPLAPLAHNLHFVRPYLTGRITPETPYLFWIRRSNFSTARTTFFQGHESILQGIRKKSIRIISK